ncbi:MAG: HD-GYP domain-containing protein [Actinomycetota bacterium]
MIAPAPLTLDLDRAVLALSDALDLVGVDKVGHGHRVALMAAILAEEMGWETPEVHELVRAGLLHDCGVSTTREHRSLVNELEWEEAPAHCSRGAVYLADVPMLAHLAPVVLEHHSRWIDMRKRRVDDQVATVANLIYLCDRVDALRAHGVAPGRDVVAVLRRYPDLFNPDFVAVLDEVARREAFWFVQDEPALHEGLTDRLEIGSRAPIDLVEIRGLAAMFGRIIDAKSPYTERHSLGVAAVARELGTIFGLGADDLDCLEMAGMLHDLGKLRIPDELLDKQGPLTAEERMRMARHAFDTWEILRHVFGDGSIARWAAMHHEAVSGQGYPFHLEGDELPLGARIVAVADVFQALAQTRPYRQPLGTTEIAGVLDGMVFAGKLDREVVDRLKAHIDACHAKAVAGEGG